MNKKIILGLFLIIAMAIASASVLAVKNINITDSEVLVSGIGGTVTGNVNVKNIGNETVNVSFSSTILVDDKGHSLQISSMDMLINVAPGTIRSEGFTVNLDNYAGNYTGVITASVEGASVSDSVLARAEIIYNGFGLSVTPSVTSSTQTDATVQQAIQVQNLANKDITATISRSGYDSLSFTLDKEGIYTFPYLSTTTVTASVGVPAGAQSKVYTGKVNFTTDATSYNSFLQTIVEPTYKANVNDITITVDPGSSSTGTVSITNAGNINLTGLSITNIPQLVDNDGDRINLTVSPNSSISVPVGSTASASVLASASNKMDSGDYTAALTLSGSGISKQFNVRVNIRDILQITSVDVDDDEIKVGDKIKIEVEVENIASDIDLKDVEIKVNLLDGTSELEDDDGDVIEEESERFKLDAGDSKKLTFEFTMPYHVDDGDDFVVHVEATGKNEDDTTERFSAVDESNTVTATKEEHELVFYKTAFDSDALSCSKSTYLRVGVRNIGDSDEDDVELAVTNAELGISKHEIFDISNDPEDDEFEVERSFLLDLKDAPVGTYNFAVTVYYDEDDEKEETTVPLTISVCTTTTGTYAPTTGIPLIPVTPTGNQTSQFTYTSGPVSGLPTVTAAAVAPRISSAKPQATSWTDSIAFLVIVGIANVLLVIVIILALVSLLRK